MKKIITWVVVLVLIAGGGVAFWRYRAAHRPPDITYKTAPVEHRTITGRVTASGTLSAIVTVQVGTQVSGRIQKLFADFNSPVTKGELVAKIDPQLFDASVQSARANWLQAKAQVVSAQATAVNADRQYARVKALLDQNLETQADLDTSQAAAAVAAAQIESAKANMAQADAQLHQAQVNLDYTNIISPIDGVVISRSVDVGQTVAASLSAPTIFTIAQDLTKMQVDTNIAEGDVGRLQVGMKTIFTVDSFPGQNFYGKIRQIRNSATTVQNVVTYDAVIDVDNSDLRLRPGMTANVSIIFAERKNVLAVSNAALRFHPPTAGGSASAATTSGGGGRGGGGGAGGGGGGQHRGGHAHAPSGTAPNPDAPPAPTHSAAPATSGSAARADGGVPAVAAAPEADAPTPKTVWVLRGATPTSVSIHAGLTDGTVTEVVDGDLKEGDQVVVDSTGGDDGSTAAAAPAGGATPRFRMF